MEKKEVKTVIMGTAEVSAEKMKKHLLSVNPDAIKYAALAETFLREGKKEGVRGDIAFAQAILETGYFRFRGDVSEDQNNYCGLGATGNGANGNSFDTPQLGIRAQIQHLKAYASEEELNEACIDVRFRYVERGCAPYVEWLGSKENPKGKGWSTKQGYGSSILSILERLKATEAEEEEMYRVRKSWEDAKSQVGAYRKLENAIASADYHPGYTVYDGDGKEVYTSFAPYLVRITIRNLNIRKKPGTNYESVGHILPGSYTIIEEAAGRGATKWGKLKSGAGWISLDYVEKVRK